MNVFNALGECALFKADDQAAFVRLILKNYNIGFDSIMYRTALIEKEITPLAERFYKWWDRILLMRLAAKGSVGIINEKLVNYRVHPGQDSQKNSSGKIENLFNLLQEYRKALPQPLSGKDKTLFYSSMADNLILSGMSFSSSLHEYRTFIKQAIAADLFRIKYVGIRGVWYALKLIRYIF